MDSPDPDEFILNLARLAKWLVFCDIPHDRFRTGGRLCLQTHDGRLSAWMSPDRFVLDGETVTIENACEAVNEMAMVRIGREILTNLSRCDQCSLDGRCVLSTGHADDHRDDAGNRWPVFCAPPCVLRKGHLGQCQSRRN